MRNLVIILLVLSQYVETSQENSCLSKPETDLITNIKVTLQKLEARLKGKKHSYCPSGWEEFSGHCYSFNVKRMNWMESETYCRRNGGYLAKIESKKEQLWIESRAKAKSLYYAWIGLKIVKGKWIWITDLQGPKDYFWADKEPCGDGECAGLLRNANWNDHPCEGKFSFICERNTNGRCLSYSRPTGGRRYIIISETRHH